MKRSLKIILFLLCYLIISNNEVSSQQVSLRVGSNYAAYDMQQLSKFQDLQSNLINEIFGIPVSNVDRFPSYFTYEAQILLGDFKSFSFGTFYNFASTGARTFYGDYSGKMDVEYKLFANSFGMIFEKCVEESEDIRIYLSSKIAYVYSDLSISNYIEVYDLSDKQDLNYTSDSYSIEPAVNIQYSFSDFSVRFNIGYMFSMGGEYILTEDDYTKLRNLSQDIGPEWSGYRFGLSFAYVFPFQFDKREGSK